MTSRRSRAAGLLAAVVVLLAGLLAPTGATAAPTLKVAGAHVTCECGGGGYLWGWNAVALEVKGAKAGRSYQPVVNGKKSGDRQIAWADTFSVLVFNHGKPALRSGKTYKFQVVEYDGKRKLRTTKALTYTLPASVQHPKRGGIDAEHVPGEDVELLLVAGREHRITFKGAWAPKARFASGVDFFYNADDEFSMYTDRRYPHSFRIGTKQPTLSYAPTLDQVGESWHILVVGYLPAKKANKARGIRKGDPIPGTEWGWNFYVRVVDPADPILDRAE